MIDINLDLCGKPEPIYYNYKGKYNMETHRIGLYRISDTYKLLDIDTYFLAKMVFVICNIIILASSTKLNIYRITRKPIGLMGKEERMFKTLIKTVDTIDNLFDNECNVLLDILHYREYLLIQYLKLLRNLIDFNTRIVFTSQMTQPELRIPIVYDKTRYIDLIKFMPFDTI